MKNAKVKRKLSIIQSAQLKFRRVYGSDRGPAGFGKSSRIFFFHRLLVYSVSSAPFIIHISAVYRAGVTAITGITSMLDRSQTLPSEETVCVCWFNSYVWVIHWICVHVYVWVSLSNILKIVENKKVGLSPQAPFFRISLIHIEVIPFFWLCVILVWRL